MTSEYNCGTFFLSHEIEYMASRNDNVQRTYPSTKDRSLSKNVIRVMSREDLQSIFVCNYKDRSSVIWVIEDSVGIGTLKLSEGKITYNCQRNSIDSDIFNEHFLS